MSKAILECNGIAAGYVKGLNILQGVDLVVSEGEIVSIIGPNGAGKSTLLKAIMGLINVSAGRFYINGFDKTNLSTHKIVNQGIGYVPQVENVFPSLSIEEIRANKPEVSDLIEKAGNLSGGQRQILALARSLVTSPKLLLLDEPSAGLSPVAINEVFTTIKEINHKGVSILLVEQKLAIAFNLSNRLYVMGHGKIVYEGTTKEIKNNDAVIKEWLEVS